MVPAQRRRQACMVDKGSQQVGAMSEPSKFPSNARAQMVRVDRCEVGQALILSVLPDLLVGVELGGVRWKLFGADPGVVGEETPDLAGSVMNVAPIPKHRPWTTDVPAQSPKESDDIRT